MARKFADTSALLKLYVAEPNSAAVRAEVDPQDEVLISRFTLLEYRSAILGKVRHGTLLEVDAVARLEDFAADRMQYDVVSLNEAVLQRAQDLLLTFTVSHGLRPPDAIQLATLLEEHRRLPIDVFLTTDSVQLQIAQSLGLVTAP